MIRYDDTVKVTCVDNNQTVDGEVLEFKPQLLLTVSLDRKIKLTLKFVTKSDEYQGELYGRTFVSKGPKGTHYSVGRKA